MHIDIIAKAIVIKIILSYLILVKQVDCGLNES